MRSARVVFGFLLLSAAAAAQQYVISTYAGGAPPPTPSPAVDVSIGAPLGVATDAAGNVYFASSHTVFKLDHNGVLMRVAGNSNSGYSGDGGPATSAQLRSPTAVALDGAGNLFIADTGNGRLRRVSPSGIITTVAGNGTLGNSGDGGPATSAQLRYPNGVAVDGAGNLFIATEDPESGDNERVRKVSPNGIITTVAGTGSWGFSGDGGPATIAQLTDPTGVAVDGAGNVYVADSGNNVVRILRPTDRSVLISAVVDAASQRADPVSPGKIVVLYGTGLGPSQLSAEPAGTAVSFNGIAAAVLYASATQIAAVVPYAVSGTTAQVTVAYRGDVSAAFTVPVAASAPSLFTLNQAGWGQAAAIHADGTANTAANPVRIGGFISLYATGEGQTGPTTPPRPILPVRVTIGGIPALIQYAGGAPGQVAGLMQVNVQIPSGVRPGGYVPVVLQVGDRASSPAVWIAVAAN